mgnify:FL=1
MISSLGFHKIMHVLAANFTFDAISFEVGVVVPIPMPAFIIGSKQSDRLLY